MKKNLIKTIFILFGFACNSSHAYKTTLYDCGDQLPTEKNCEKICRDTKGIITIEVNVRDQIVMTAVELDEKKSPLGVLKNCSVVREKVWSCKSEITHENRNGNFFMIESSQSFNEKFYISTWRETRYLNGKIKSYANHSCGLTKSSFWP